MRLTIFEITLVNREGKFKTVISDMPSNFSEAEYYANIYKTDDEYITCIRRIITPTTTETL